MTRSGFVALIGEPNAGKSTLLNQMVGAKISIVTHKVQTTRTRIRGVSVENQSQIIFVDTRVDKNNLRLIFYANPTYTRPGSLYFMGYNRNFCTHHLIKKRGLPSIWLTN